MLTPAAKISDKAITDLFAAMGQRVRIAHVPLRAASMAATVAEWHGRVTGSAEPSLSRYAVDQLAHDVVLDISKAAEAGWLPRRSLPDYLCWLSSRRGAEVSHAARVYMIVVALPAHEIIPK
jgi:2-alkyl-3-oxoalkanoate reductase